MGKMVLDETDLPEVLSEYGAEQLVCAILRIVIRDYRKALKKLEIKPDSNHAKGEKIRCEVALRYWNMGEEELRYIREGIRKGKRP